MIKYSLQVKSYSNGNKENKSWKLEICQHIYIYPQNENEENSVWKVTYIFANELKAQNFSFLTISKNCFLLCKKTTHSIYV